MTKEFSIRRATLADSEQVLHCLQEAFEPYRKNYTELAYIDTVLTPETLRTRLSEMQILVAADIANRVIGTIAYKVSNGEGHIRGMAVLPKYQGSGLAAALLTQAESDLRELQCRTVTLDTTSPLKRAIRFYERNGFRWTGEVTAFFGMELFAYRKDF
jgi:ribosomal protein S18 acetylase RimI-like enzyme